MTATTGTTDEVLIGPLTAAEWAEFRLRNDGDLLQCCGVTSEFRDHVFDLLRMGPESAVNDGQALPWRASEFRGAYWRLVDHGLPEPGTRSRELIDRLAAFYLGDPPTPADDVDTIDGDDLIVELCKRSGEPTLHIATDRYTVCALPPEHKAHRYLAIHVDRARPGTDRWRIRWGSYIHNSDADPDSPWEPEASAPDGVDPAQWWTYREFTLAFAMRVAREQATRVTVSGRTAADIAAGRPARLEALG